MFGKKPDFLPEKDAQVYKGLSYLLYILFIIFVFFATLALLFPYSLYDFDFNNPNATKNTIFYPHTEDYREVVKGKIPAENRLSFFVNDPHILESASIEISPTVNDKKYPNLTGQLVTVRHGWAAFFLTRGTDAISTPTVMITEYQGRFYEKRDMVLYPFVSEAAALSFVPREKIQQLSPNSFQQYSISEEIIGFRVGTLLSYGDGVYIVTEDNITRPFGSPKILLSLGYSFNHVIPANGEEVGIYKRGKIIYQEGLHPSGTLFRDVDSGRLFIFQDNKVSPLEKNYGEYLSQRNDVVPFSEDQLKKESTCFLTKDIFEKSFSCTLPISFSEGFGEDYQVSLDNPEKEIDLTALRVGTQASRKEENAKFVLKLLFNRVLQRVGITLE